MPASLTLVPNAYGEGDSGAYGSSYVYGSGYYGGVLLIVNLAPGTISVLPRLNGALTITPNS